MAATAILGQDSTAGFEVVPFERGGLNGSIDLAVGPMGDLWVLHNFGGLLATYFDARTTGQRWDHWINLATRKQPDGDFPLPLGTARRLKSAPDGSLWLFPPRDMGSPVSSQITRLRIPVLTQKGIVNAASYAEAPFAPGTLVTAFGLHLGSRTGTHGAVEQGTFPSTLNGTTVLVNGKPAPLLYARNDQVTFQLPFSLEPGQPVSIRAQNGGVSSPAVNFTLARSSPGVFSADGSRAAAISPLGQGNTLARGQWATVFASGLGAVEGEIREGQLAPSELRPTRQAVEVYIEGVLCQTLFAGLAPGLAGVYQVNFLVPERLAASSAARLVLLQGGEVSRPVLVTLR